MYHCCFTTLTPMQGEGEVIRKKNIALRIAIFGMIKSDGNYVIIQEVREIVRNRTTGECFTYFSLAFLNYRAVSKIIIHGLGLLVCGPNLWLVLVDFTALTHVKQRTQ